MEDCRAVMDPSSLATGLEGLWLLTSEAAAVVGGGGCGGASQERLHSLAGPVQGGSQSEAGRLDRGRRGRGVLRGGAPLARPSLNSDL